MKIPQHVAIILDGNGRWAKGKGMPRNYGHAQGSKNVERICEESWRMGIKYLTVYAFSTENWNRPKDEVDALMKLLRNYMKTCLKTAAKNDMKVRVIGDLSGLDEDIKGCLIIFCVSWRIQSSILQMYCGRILPKKSWRRLLNSTIAETAVTAG